MRVDAAHFRSMVSDLSDAVLASTTAAFADGLRILDEERLRRVKPLSRQKGTVSRSVKKAKPGAVKVHAPAVQTSMKLDGAEDERILGYKRAARAIIAADADIVPGEHLVSQAGTLMAYKYRGVSWMLSQADAERRGVPHLGGRVVCYAWGRPLAQNGAASTGGDESVPF